jgi:hypothetical protein
VRLIVPRLQLVHVAADEHAPLLVPRSSSRDGRLIASPWRTLRYTGSACSVASIHPPRLAHAEPVAGSSTTVPFATKKKRAMTSSFAPPPDVRHARASPLAERVARQELDLRACREDGLGARERENELLHAGVDPHGLIAERIAADAEHRRELLVRRLGRPGRERSDGSQRPRVTGGGDLDPPGFHVERHDVRAAEEISHDVRRPERRMAGEWHLEAGG